MFKYKSTPIILLIILSFSVIFIYLIKNISKEEVKENDKLMTNNIEILGIITNLKVSGNHDFGILQLKLTETNKDSFSPFVKDKIYPYTIKDSIAEIYTHFTLPEIKKGYIVAVDSNNKTIIIYDKNKFLYKWDISMITEELDINFMKKHSIFKYK